MGNKIDIEQDLPFQYRQWRMERLGQVLIACCIMAALLGLFGHSPLSTAARQTVDGRLSIHYDRFARNETNTDLLVTLNRTRMADGIVRLWLDQDYLDAFKVTAVSPVPIRGEARDGARAFVFQTDGSRFTATLSVQFEAVGLVHGSVRADEGKPSSDTFCMALGGGAHGLHSTWAAVYVFLIDPVSDCRQSHPREITNFDFVLLLIISEATQNAMIGNDYS